MVFFSVDDAVMVKVLHQKFVELLLLLLLFKVVVRCSPLLTVCAFVRAAALFGVRR